MTRKASRNYSRVVVPFITILTLLIAAAVLAQVPSADRTSGQANAALAPAGTSALAQGERPLSPSTGAGSSPVSRPQKKRHSARPMDGNPPLFAPAVVYNDGGLSPYPYSVAVGDLNGDGKPDLVLFNSGSIGVLLGNGDGTFQPVVTYDSGGSSTAGSTVAIADVNNDGKPDLVVMNSDTNNVGVLLGNGDGTFQPVVSYYLGGGCCGFPGAVAVADVNLDGRPDLLADASSCYTSIFVLLGNGDGTFTYTECGWDYSKNFYSGGWGDDSIAAADLNGDGKPDVVAANGPYEQPYSNNVGVLLGNGDGTLQSVSTYGSGGLGPLFVAVADVNGDNKPDLVLANCGSNTAGWGCSGSGEGSVAVLLGNGDGTFQPAVAYDSGGLGAFGVAIADVNGDGIPDLVVANAGSNNIGVLLGNGDGTFQPVVTFASGGSYPRSIAVADVNGDGKLDVLVADYNSGTVDVLLNISNYTTSPSTTVLDSSSLNPSTFGEAVTFAASVSSAAGTPTGTVEFFDGAVFLGSATLVSGKASFSASWLEVGADPIIARYKGDGVYLISASGPFSQIVNKATSAASLVSSANPAGIKQGVTYTATVTSQHGAVLTGTVAFQDGGSTIATVPLAKNQAAYSTSYQTAGVHVISATYSGDANNVGSISSVLTEVIGKGPFPSKTTLAASGSPSLVGQPVKFTATVTSTYGTIPDGELVTFYDNTTTIGTSATASGVATFVTSSLAAKTHIIKAAYGGDALFKPSYGSVEQIVEKYTTTTTLSSSLNPSNYGHRVTLMATVTSAGPAPTGTVIFKNGSATLGSGTLNTSGVAILTTAKIPVGADTLTATYNGDAWNGKSVSAGITQTVSQASITMVLASTPNPSASGTSVKLTAKLTSNGGLPSGQPVTFSYNNATLGTANVNSTGVATFSTTTLPQGSDVVTAAYAGSSDYSSASATVTQVVN